LPWIANINDPWELNFFPGVNFPKVSSVRTRGYLFWLRRTLQNADLITYPCKGLQGFHAELANLDHPAEIIPHIGSRSQNLGRTNNGNFRLVHTGKLGNSEVTRRSTKALLMGLKAFIGTSAAAAARIRLVLVGPEDKETAAFISELGLQNNIEQVGSVNYEDSLKYIGSATACVLIETGADKSIFFPSKLADYIVSRKPVLALSPRTGVAADLAARGEMIRIDHDPVAVRDAIAALYSDFVLGTLSCRIPSDRLIEQLCGHSVADQFLTACTNVISRRRPALSVACVEQPANLPSELQRAS
jgi:hypothetical protein